MTREEAEAYAKEMTYRDAVYNALQGKCIPYRKATLIKLYELLDRLDKEPKTWHWIYKQYDGYPECGNYHCSECDKIDNHIPAYCPHCGCAMIEQQKSEG